MEIGISANCKWLPIELFWEEERAKWEKMDCNEGKEESGISTLAGLGKQSWKVKEGKNKNKN